MKLFQKLTKVQKLLLLMLIGFLLIGKIINLTSDDVVIQSNNFNVDKYGNMSCSNANISGTVTSSNATITGGSINMYGDEYSPAIRIHDNQSNEIEMYPSNFNMYYDYSPYGTIGQYLQKGGYFVENESTGESTTVWYNGITTPTLTQTSLQSQKKNFEKLENALDIIKSIDIYKYNFKNENDEDKKHIGFVIGPDFEYSTEVTSKNNKGVDIYSFVSVCCRAIQEQQEQIEALQKEVKELKEGLNDGLL